MSALVLGAAQPDAAAKLDMAIMQMRGGGVTAFMAELSEQRQRGLEQMQSDLFAMSDDEWNALMAGDDDA